jgi:hypothetical protein
MGGFWGRFLKAGQKNQPIAARQGMNVSLRSHRPYLAFDVARLYLRLPRTGVD